MKIAYKGNKKTKEVVLLSHLRVARVTFFEVIPGVKVPDRRELPLKDNYEHHFETFNGLFGVSKYCRLGGRWSLPAVFQPVNGANAWDHRESYSPLED